MFCTSSADADIVYLEVRHRRHAHVEDRIKTAKALGLDHFPSNDFETNAALADRRADRLRPHLLDPTLATLHWGHGQSRTEKAALGAVARTAGKVTTTGRRSTLHLDVTWPWATTLQKGFHRLHALHFTT